MDNSIDEIAGNEAMTSKRTKAAPKSFRHGQIEHLVAARESSSNCHQEDVRLYALSHGGAFPSSEEESTAEVDDDYDDESCSSYERDARQGLVMTLDKNPGDNITPVPPAATVSVTPMHRLAGATVIRLEEASSEISHILQSDLPAVASTIDAVSVEMGENFLSDPFHSPRALPKFRDPKMCMWTSSHAANCPSEDRSSSLVNVLLKPFSNATRQLVRLSLWSVIDGHGGGCVATYASEVLLPHITANVARALKCEIVDRGVCTVNGELRDANALDLDGLIRSSDRNRAIANSIQYRAQSATVVVENVGPVEDPHGVMARESVPHFPYDGDILNAIRFSTSNTLPVVQPIDPPPALLEKESVKTGAFHHRDDILVGTHSPGEIASITQSITDSFLAVDEGWINSIDPIATHQTSCESNGRWNAGACALVVFTVQCLEWTSAMVSLGRVETDPRDDTPHNQDAARRRSLDFATEAKRAVSFSSNSSILTDGDAQNLSALESEITETEDDGEESDHAQPCRKSMVRQEDHSTTIPTESVITTVGGCNCHAYKAHDCMLYTAHVGDCRAVLLGSAPPRTIKVGLVGDAAADNPDTTDDESSHHSSDETECLSSSDHDAESSDEDISSSERASGVTMTPPYLTYMRRRARRRSRRDMSSHAPFVALPPLPISPHSSSEDSESDSETLIAPTKLSRLSDLGHDSDDNSNESSLICGRDMSPPLLLSPSTRPIDLTTDHSAYNPAEVSLVLRRCNNAPRAISSSVGGGIKRVAGSLAVTRALGDAYLKTAKLSFEPYAAGCPYITAEPEVKFRLLSKDGDRALILATDGVWERCSGEDVLRWVRNHSSERIAQAERKIHRRLARQSERLPQDDEVLAVELASPPMKATDEDDAFPGQKRVLQGSGSASPKKRKVVLGRASAAAPCGAGTVSTVADVIVRRVLNKVRRARNMTSLQALLSLPKGRARRSKHDDITASVIDLSAFVS